MIETHLHKQDGKLIVERKQDVEPIIEHAAELRKDVKEVPGLGYHVGTIPMVIVQKYLTENKITYEQFMKDSIHIHRILTDPDYSKFRVWQGNPGRAK